MRRFFLINVILSVLVLFLVFRLYGIWTKPEEKVLPQKKTFSEKGKTEITETKKDIISYKIIAQKDLFRPSRAGLVNEDITSGLSLSNKPKLFGVLIMDNDRIAILEDPTSNKRKKFRVKDPIGNFIVSEIESNRVLLLRGEETVVVNLREIKTIPPPPKRTGTVPQMPGTAPKSPSPPTQKLPLIPIPAEEHPIIPEALHETPPVIAPLP